MLNFAFKIAEVLLNGVFGNLLNVWLSAVCMFGNYAKNRFSPSAQSPIPVLSVQRSSLFLFPVERSSQIGQSSK